MADADRRRDKWERFAPYQANLHLIVPEIADELDDAERERALDRKELARMKGIMFGILVSTSTGSILLALNLIAGKA